MSLKSRIERMERLASTVEPNPDKYLIPNVREILSQRLEQIHEKTHHQPSQCGVSMPSLTSEELAALSQEIRERADNILSR